MMKLDFLKFHIWTLTHPISLLFIYPRSLDGTIYKILEFILYKLKCEFDILLLQVIPQLFKTEQCKLLGRYRRQTGLVQEFSVGTKVDVDTTNYQFKLCFNF